VGAWLNLFNLLPVWQLDGSRGFAALSRPQRALAAAALGGAFLLTGEGLLVLLGLAAVVRCFTRDLPATGDRLTLVHYVGLVAALAALCELPVPAI
jgi:Zn-dependent protease